MGTIKVFDKCGLFTWSPSNVFPIYIVSGTTAQQFDASFSTEATLNVFEFNPASLNSLSSMSNVRNLHKVDQRFCKLAWSSFGPTENGLIVGGCDNGAIQFYDPKHLLVQQSSTEPARIFKQSQKHSGSVRALDVNPFQGKLLASGASNSEVFIWDLHNPDNPMSPGPKSHLAEQVTSVGWSPQVEHILASLTSSHCLVWDLRKSDGPIMKFGDVGASRSQWVEMKWHPEVPTTLCMASADDHFPVVQMWDVRFANAPCISLEGHQRGILSMDWCPKDPDVLVTCGKDNKIYVWNPNTGDYLAEIKSNGTSWPYELKFCSRNSDLVGCSSFDGLLSIYTMTGSGSEMPMATASPKLAESFPGADFSRHMQIQQQAQTRQPFVLPKPVKWLASKCGARFGFGGKLISFEKSTPSQQHQVENNFDQSVETSSKIVNVNQVIIETDLYEKANELNDLLTNSNVLQYAPQLCEFRASQCNSELDRQTWLFLKAHLERKPRCEYTKILGFNFENALKQVKKIVPEDSPKKDTQSASQLNDSFPSVHSGAGTASNAAATNGRIDDGDNDESDIEDIDEEIWPSDLISLEKSNNAQPVDSLLCQLIASGRFESAVDYCIENNRWIDALQLAAVSGGNYYKQVQRKYFEMCQDPISKVITLIANEKWTTLTNCLTLNDWQLVFSFLLNYVTGRELSSYLDTLGNRLENEESGRLGSYSVFCYICAGLVDKFVNVLCTTVGGKRPVSPIQLHEIVEKATILRLSLGGGSQRVVDVGHVLAEQLGKYSFVLAEQGFLLTAYQLLEMLPEDVDEKLSVLRYRLFNACSALLPSNAKRPKNPFASALALTEMTNKTRAMSLGNGSRKVSATIPAFQQPPTVQQQQWGGVGQTLKPPPIGQQNQTTPAPPVGGFAQSNQYPSNYQQYQNAYGVTSSYANFQTPSQQIGPPPVAVAPVSVSTMSSAMSSRARYPSYSNTDGISYPTPAGPGMQVPSAPGHHVTQQTAAHHVTHQQPPHHVTHQPAYHQYASPLSLSASGDRLDSHWNDPPPLSPRKRQVSVPRSDSSAPVVHPFSAKEENTPSSGRDSINSNFNQPNQPVRGNSSSSSRPSPSAAAVVQQAEPARIPSEHQVIVEVLDRLGYVILNHSNTNLQVRRRVEENLHKLHDHLGDQLIKRKLMEATLTDLHQIVYSIQSQNCQSALQIHSKLVQGRDFDNISGFMAPLKVLLQTAIQLNVSFG